MRRFFSFRFSSASSGGKENPAPPAPSDENVYWETPGENAPRNVAGAGGQRKSRPSKASGSPHLRRSLSFSSPGSSGVEGKCNFTGDAGGFLSDDTNIPHQVAESLTQTPQRLLKSKRYSQGTVQKSHTFEKLDSPKSSKGHHGSSGNSPYSSPVPLRCRSSRVAESLNPNNILDLYIDGEQHERRSRKDLQHCMTEDDGCLVEKRTLPGFGRPPRAQYTAPSSSNNIKERLRSHSVREDKVDNQSFSNCNWPGDNIRVISPRKYSRKVIGRQSCGKDMTKVLDSESQTTTTTVEDIYEDSSNDILQKCALSDHIPADDHLNENCTEEAASFHEQSHFLWDGSIHITHESALCLSYQDDGVEEELARKLTEAEEKIKMLPELDTDFGQLWSDKLCTSGFVHVVREMIQERKNLALELSSQIRSRISERSSTMEALKQSRIDLDTRTMRLERETNELKSTLERELDRRSKDWSLKVEKFQAEEKRLRERVRELAEQNVSLQREVSLHRGKEMETQSRIMNSETKLNEITMRLEETKSDNSKLQQALSELQEQCNMAEANEDCLKRNYKEKEKETKELQKAVAKLQMVCSELEKTITGLRRGYADQIGKQTPDSGDLGRKLQMEHIRLTGVEQILRKEVESLRLEVEALRQENVYILGRLRCAGSSGGSRLFRIDQELGNQIECIQSQALSLLDDSNELCGKLLKVANSKQCERGHAAIHESDGYSVVECNMKLESLRRAVKNFRGRLESVSATLDQRSKLESLECQSQKTENGFLMQCDVPAREDEMELELKAETLLTRALRGKLFYKEQELEQLQCELGCSVCRNDILKSEIQRLQDEISCLTHKTKDMELKMMKKDATFNKLQQDLQECTTELTISRDILPRVSEERDCLWEEVKKTRETNMLLDYEVKSLKKKIETLDEDILIKEGQITILKDSLGDKPFDILYSPTTMEQHILE